MKAPLFSRIDKAFGVAPDPRLGFDSSSFVSAYLSLMRGIEERAGLMVLVGVAGCGKTTLLRTIEEAIARNRGLALYRRLPEEGFEGLLGSLLDELRLTPASPGREDGLDTLGEFLSGRNTPPVLLVDEAHRVPNRTLVGLARLAMFQHGETESLQVILAGQSQLEERLQRPELAWIADHVAAMVHLEPLMADELADYVVHRLALARSSLSLRRTRNPFAREALDRLLQYSDGVPGTLNRLCGSALSGSPKHVDVAQVDRAALECGLVPPPGPVAAAVGQPPASPVHQERDIAPQTITPRRKALRIGYAAPIVIAAGIGGGFTYLAYFGGGLNLPFAVTVDAVRPRPPPVAVVAVEPEAPAVDATGDQAAAPDAAMPGTEIPADEPQPF